MSARVCVPPSWSVCRIVSFREDPGLREVSVAALVRMASRYLEQRVPPSLLERILLQERRVPLEVSLPDRALVGQLREYAHLGAFVGLGPMEANALGAATHGVLVGTRATPHDWQWAQASVVAFCRGLARELRGVVYDGRSGQFRPFADSDAGMAGADPVPLDELTRTVCLPGAAGAWTVRTQGLRNVGLPDLYLEDVPDRCIRAARPLIRVARNELCTLLRRGPGRHRVDEISVGGHLGAVGVRPSRCPTSGDAALRLFPYGMPDLSLGAALEPERDWLVPGFDA